MLAFGTGILKVEAVGADALLASSPRKSFRISPNIQPQLNTELESVKFLKPQEFAKTFEA